MEHTKAYKEFKKQNSKKYVRYPEGAEMYSMSLSKFQQLAKDAKVTELKKCYKQASIVTGHIFYLPIMKEDVWRITKYQNGIEETLTIDQFRNFVLNK